MKIISLLHFPLHGGWEGQMGYIGQPSAEFIEFIPAYELEGEALGIHDKLKYWRELKAIRGGNMSRSSSENINA
jgi:hypothetical protein